VTVPGEQSSSEYLLFPALKKTLGGHIVKDNRQVEADVTRWLLAQDTD
jgi:hypothetical protein